MHSTKQQNRRYYVAEPSLLAAEIRRALNERFDGKQLAAATDLRIQQSQISRLLSGSTRAITRRTLEWIRRLVPEERHSHVWNALLSPETRRLIRHAYIPWRKERENRFLKRKGSRWTGTAAGIAKAPPLHPFGHSHTMASPPREQERNYLLTYLRWGHSEITSMRDAPVPQPWRSSANTFIGWARGRGHSDDRIRISLIRVVEPLLESRESGFVERGWEEMGDAELRQFFEHGFARERLLLKRSPDDRRAQEVMARAPSELTEPNWARRMFRTSQHIHSGAVDDSPEIDRLTWHMSAVVKHVRKTLGLPGKARHSPSKRKRSRPTKRRKR